MIELYYILVKQGRRTINQVPDLYRTEVHNMLDVISTD